MNDIKFALRTFRKSPGFAVVAVLTLALGIGANTAIFSVVSAVLLHPLPFPKAAQLMQVGMSLPRQSIQNAGMSYPEFLDWQRQAQSFAAMGAFQQSQLTLTGVSSPQLVSAATVSPGFFPTLAVTPIAGRTFNEQEDQEGAAPTVLMSEKMWRQQFGGDRNLVGRAITLDGKAFTVIGILPGNFLFPYLSPPEEMWVPLHESSLLKNLLPKRGGHYLTVIARLKDGVTPAQADAEVKTIAARQAAQYPAEDSGWTGSISPLSLRFTGPVRLPLLILLASVVCVLLIACSNVANLLLARGSTRSRELAIRSALGASRGRIVQQLLTESLLLAVIGGTAGVLGAWWCLSAFHHLLPQSLPHLQGIGIDRGVLGFALLATLGAGVLFGLAPAWQGSEGSLEDAIKTGGRTAGVARKGLRTALVMAEVAISFVLLVGAGLMMRSLWRLQSVDPGFNPKGVLTFGLNLPRQRYPMAEQWNAAFDQILGRLRGLPGVEAAAASIPLPLTDSLVNIAYDVAGRPPSKSGEGHTADYFAVSPDFFRALEVRLLRGRVFTEADSATAPKVCLISQEFARLNFPDSDPIGQTLKFGFAEVADRRIVGVVADVKPNSLNQEAQPEMYAPFAQDTWWTAAIEMRAPAGAMAALPAEVRQQVHEVDGDLPVEDLSSMDEVVSQSLVSERFRTTLVGLFAAVALALGAIGIYGVLSYMVTTRWREIGVRMALGASRERVFALFLKEAARPVVAGLIIGGIVSIWLTGYMASLLFQVKSADPLTFGVIGGVLLFVAFLATFIPARRATQVDPMVALRYD